jgi:hypothetical protein
VVVAEPGGHGGGTVVAPQLGGVVLAHRGQQLGIESIRQDERVGHTPLSMGRSRWSIA